MNKQQRKRLSNVSSVIGELISKIDATINGTVSFDSVKDDIMSSIEGQAEALAEIRDEEQEKMDNMPENLQGGERYQEMEEVISVLDDVIGRMESIELESEDDLEGAKEELEAIQGEINEYT